MCHELISGFHVAFPVLHCGQKFPVYINTITTAANVFSTSERSRVDDVRMDKTSPQEQANRAREVRHGTVVTYRSGHELSGG